MKNKPAPALLRPSNLSNEIKKRVPISRETTPLRVHSLAKEFLAIHNKFLETIILSRDGLTRFGKPADWCYPN
jgi:hypothetical protein